MKGSGEPGRERVKVGFINKDDILTTVSIQVQLK